MAKRVVALGVLCVLAGCSLFSLEKERPKEGTPESGSHWYNQAYLKDLFGDFEKLEEAYVTDEETKAVLVDRGRYLVQNAAACGSCHSGGQNFSVTDAPLSGGKPMTDQFGPVNAANITPDDQTGIGKWSSFDISRAIRASIDKDGRPMSLDLHANYRWLSDRDAKAIALYLLSQPPVFNAVERRQLGGFERNRWGVISMHADIAGYVPDPIAGPTYQYGQYLANNVSSCVSCHTPGASLTGETPFSGAAKKAGWTSLFSFEPVISSAKSAASSVVDAAEGLGTAAYQLAWKSDSKPPDTPQVVTPMDKFQQLLQLTEQVSGKFPIMGPDIRGGDDGALKNWSEEDYVRYLSSGETPSGSTSNGSYCPWPFFSGMSGEDKLAIARYLKRL